TKYFDLTNQRVRRGVETSATEAEHAFVSPEGEPKTTKAGASRPQTLRGRSALRQAGLLHQHGVDLAGTMHAADQDLLDVGSAAGPGDEHDGAPGVQAGREPFQDLLQGRENLRARVEGQVDGRSERRKLAAFGQAAQDHGARLRQHEIDARDPNRRPKALLAKGFLRACAVDRVLPGTGFQM